jgi:RND family efflux transporter MFP subunit
VSIATLASLLRSPAALISAAILVGAGCSKEPGDGTPASAAAATTKGNRPGAPGSDKGANDGGAPGGRRAASIILAASDVKAVERGTIEAGIAISGDLRAIEEAVVRARLEGDLVGVYVREGDHVKEGQLLARFEDSEQESNRTSAIADREAAQSDLETAKWNAEQAEQLFKAGAIAERDLRTAQQTLAASRARLAAAEARVRATTSLLTDTRALAPTMGMVAKRSVENGEHVARGADMFTVVRSDILELAAASRLARRARFASARGFITLRAGAISTAASHASTLDRPHESVDHGVYAGANGAGELKANSFATGRIVSRTVDGAIVIPAQAIRQAQGSDKPFVYRLDANDALERASVSVGIVDESQAIAEITEGLNPGDRIIVGNAGTLGAGMKVTIAGGGEGPNPGGNRGSANRRPAPPPGP